MIVAPASLTPQTETVVQAIGEAEVLVGIPSYNNADTIGHVVRAISVGLAKYFPRARAVLVNSDGGSWDGTPEVVAQSVVDYGAMLISERQSLLHKIITPYHGLPGKGSAFRTVVEIARRLKAKGSAVADLSAMLVQVAGALFSLMEEHQTVWTSIEGSKPVTLFGFQYQVGVEPVHVNIDAMIANFRQGLADLEPIWRQMLAAETLEG